MEATNRLPPLRKLSWRTFRTAKTLAEGVDLAKRGFVSRTVIEDEALVEMASPLLIPQHTASMESFARSCFKHSYWAAPIEAVVMPDVTFFTKRSLMVIQNRFICDELDYECDIAALPDVFKPDLPRYTIIDWLQDRAIRAPQVSGTCLLVHPKWHHNYTHWHTEALSQLPMIAPHSSVIDAVAVPNNTSFQSPSLTCQDIGGIPFIKLEEQAYHFEIMIILTNSFFRTWLHPNAGGALRKVRDSVYAAFGLSSLPERPVYLARLDAAARPMTNEPALCEMLALLGFDIIVASKLSFDDQVRALARANILVGPHGSGLTNMLYLADHVPVIELRPHHAHNRSPFWDASYQMLAHLLNHPFGALFFENVPNEDVWCADISHARECIVACLSR